MAEELQTLVDSIVASTAGLPDPKTLASWEPDLSGDIDIVIHSDGSWSHGGSPIGREGLVRLFASLLRREADNAYYLVTPVEKWRIRVERHALVAVDCDRTGHNGDGTWFVLLNTGGRCRIGGPYQLHVQGVAKEGAVEPCAPGADDAAPSRGDADESAAVNAGTSATQPWVDLPNGLTAQLTRAAWYRLTEAASIRDGRAFIVSAGEVIDLGAVDTG
ncbi:MAG: DUF1285 domain-containing protein [Halieaceae bacterium]|jgi:hypothetical protein|nr:DUF1285 domain-containing protein [Halieaceae bacterium]